MNKHRPDAYSTGFKSFTIIIDRDINKHTQLRKQNLSISSITMGLPHHNNLITYKGSRPS